MSITKLPQVELDEMYTYVLKRFASYGDKYEHIRKRSVDAPDSIPEQVDFVYIDADHSYEGVFTDLCTWFPKVREGGIIGGHDYGRSGFGVTRAVDKFFRRFGWSIHTEKDYVWWIEKKTPGISFIVPAYNYASLVQETIESIFDNNFSPGDELIIVNDGSTDDTSKVLSALKIKYPVITLLTHTENRGPSAARNTGITSARNPLIFNLDQDNILVSGSIPKLREYLLSSGADAAVFQEMHCFKKDTSKISIKWVFRPTITLADCLVGGRVPISSGNYMFTKESWIKAGGYPEFAFILGTRGFGFRQLATGTKMVAMPESFYFHRYGYASHWVRNRGRGDKGLLMLKVLLPFSHLFYEEDVAYMLSHKNQWLHQLRAHPIRVKGCAPGKAGRSFRVKK